MYIKTPVLYLLVIMAWGGSWYAVKLQTEYLAITQLIGYRFVISFLLLLGILKAQKTLKKLSYKQHGGCILLGATLFAFNYYTFYHAALYITSGLLAVIFSLAPIMNSFNSYFWFKKSPDLFTIIGAILGLLGVVVLFFPDLQKDFYNTHLWWSIMLCVMGTFFFSLGNMISTKLNFNPDYLPTITCWGMLYGSLLMFIVNWFLQQPLAFSLDFTYISSLFYLVVIGSIIAFLAYLELINRIGADKAAYTTIVIPTIAVLISLWLEDYQWNISILFGLLLVTLGNIIIFNKNIR